MMMLIMESYADILKVIEIIKAEIEAVQLDLDYWLGKATNIHYLVKVLGNTDWIQRLSVSTFSIIVWKS